VDFIVEFASVYIYPGHSPFLYKLTVENLGTNIHNFNLFKLEVIITLVHSYFPIEGESKYEFVLLLMWERLSSRDRLVSNLIIAAGKLLPPGDVQSDASDRISK
jgi:hypothetical protein